MSVVDESRPLCPIHRVVAPAAEPGVHARPAGTGRSLAVTQRRVIRSEWIKLRSVRSWMIMIAAAAVLLIAFGALAASVASGAVTPPVRRPAARGGRARSPAPIRPRISLAGVTLAQLILGILGVLFISNEYANGHDPQHLRRRAPPAAGAVGQGVVLAGVAGGGDGDRQRRRVPGRPADPRRRQEHHAGRRRRAAGRDRIRAVPGRDRRPRHRDRGADAEHRRRDRRGGRRRC